MSRILLKLRDGMLLSMVVLAWAGVLPSGRDVLADGASEVNMSRVVARVNGEAITEEQVLRRLQAVDPRVEEHRSDPNRWARLLESATEAEILDRLLLQAARKQGMPVSAADVDAKLRRSRELLGDQAFEAMLVKRGLREADYAAFLEERLLVERYRAGLLKDVAIDDETLREYYRGHKEGLRSPARAHLQVLSAGDGDTAVQIAEAWRASTEPETSPPQEDRVKVVQLWVDEADLPVEIRRQVEAAKPGDVLGPFEDHGEHRILLVQERQPERRLSYDEAKERIRSKLQSVREQKALDQWYEQAKRSAEIEYYRH